MKTALFLLFVLSGPLFVLAGVTIAVNNFGGPVFAGNMGMLCIAVLMPASFIAAYLVAEFDN